MKRRFSKLIAVLAAAGSTIAVPLHAAGPTSADLMNDAESTGDVLSYGLGPWQQRFSPLDTLNADNVSKLVPAFAASLGGEKQRGQEAQPLVYDGTIYVTGSYSRLFAFDARTGEKKWEYNARLPDAIMPCCDVVNRGAAIHGDKVIFATLDAHLIALNRETGKVVWNKKLADYQAGYSATAAPLIVKDMVITGNSGGEFGIIGEVQARNVDTGELIWSRPTIEGHMGMLNGRENGVTGKTGATWPGDMWKTGGGATWLGGTYDPGTNLLFFGTGNPAPWNSHLRPGDNLYSCSTVAIDVATGQIKWHFQGTPNDGWDYDGTNEFVTFDAGGKRLGGKADRNGFFYVLDANTGKFERGFPFVKKLDWAKGLDENGRPIYDPAKRPGDPTASEDGKKGSVVHVSPSFLGGKNQMPMAYSPDTGLFYVPANEWSMEIWNEPITYKKGAAYLGAGFTIKTADAKDIGGDYIGALRAVDPKSGKVVWEITNNAPLWGGAMTTKGGLVFWGTPEGFFKAADAKTGKELWSFQVGTGIVAPPITWEQDGEQYVAVTAGWGGAVPLWGGDVAKKVSYLNQGGSMWVFKLMKD